MSPPITRTDSPNIAARLTEIVRRHPSAPAVALPARRDRATHVRTAQLSYGRLDEISDEMAVGLRAIGFAPGTRAVLMVPPGPDLFALVFAVLKAGVVPVLIDPGIGLRHLGRCCREAAPEAFIGVPKAILAGRIFGWGRDTVRRRIVVVPGGDFPSPGRSRWIACARRGERGGKPRRTRA